MNLKIRKKAAALWGFTSAVMITGISMAQTPTLPAIEFPVDTASIVTALVAAGVAILILWVPVKIGFRLVYRLVSKISHSAG